MLILLTDDLDAASSCVQKVLIRIMKFLMYLMIGKHLFYGDAAVRAMFIHIIALIIFYL
jgi:hypothetical protein